MKESNKNCTFIYVNAYHMLSFALLLLLNKLINIFHQRFQYFPALWIQSNALLCWQPFTIFFEIFAEIDVDIALENSNREPFIFSKRPILFTILINLSFWLRSRLLIELFFLFTQLLAVILFILL